ncbi:MAG: DUF554 domain-containing protein [Chloroflexi bacterium]|jgi:uncharacterized protein|nr:DUF554 domain-containing protein [Chloroflexota bacterium]MBT3669731.1 DUF554 domain-containing protein [Chloroflexota bacterium]MBT4003421.1 DUF554 domain-containing protein [Chloroflexota bacterium]MBT4305211.1 DUF554 domain-containing protein [Chloroflexota bacterium]MBT4534866.1 DUF554 domain-containing protein [Chloroflexota bacterium]
MTGTILNIITVLIGGTIGLIFGSRFPDRSRQTIVAGLGLFTMAIGLNMFNDSGNILIVLGSLLVGGLLGEWLKIESKLEAFGAFLENRFIGESGKERKESNFIKGFFTTSLLFVIGPMAILGSIQDGLSGDYELLAIKSILDGFAAMAFASIFGVGVLFSVIVILGFQGGISLLAVQIQSVFNEAMVNEMTAVGGVILLGIAISSLLEIKKIRVGNFLPSLAIAPIIVAILAWIGVSGY